MKCDRRFCNAKFFDNEGFLLTLTDVHTFKIKIFEYDNLIIQFKLDTNELCFELISTF